MNNTLILLSAFLLCSHAASASCLSATSNCETFFENRTETEKLQKKQEDDSPYKITLWNPKNGEDKDRLWSQTKLIFGLGVGVAGLITLLPTDISNWDLGGGDEGLAQKWWDNVKGGPIWDEDVWTINYIGHTYFGGVYYQVARKSGYSQWDSFSYSALMSTFYWEYGLEAFAEVPSIQDLVVTPIGGWIYGEWAHQTEKDIIANGGTVWGSKEWGDVSLFFLDPVGTIGNGINSMLGKDFINTGTGMISPHPIYFEAAAGESYSGYWGVNMVFTF